MLPMDHIGHVATAPCALLCKYNHVTANGIGVMHIMQDLLATIHNIMTGDAFIAQDNYSNDCLSKWNINIGQGRPTVIIQYEKEVGSDAEAEYVCCDVSPIEIMGQDESVELKIKEECSGAFDESLEDSDGSYRVENIKSQSKMDNENQANCLLRQALEMGTPGEVKIVGNSVGDFQLVQVKMEKVDMLETRDDSPMDDRVNLQRKSKIQLPPELDSLLQCKRNKELECLPIVESHANIVPVRDKQSTSAFARNMSTSNSVDDVTISIIPVSLCEENLDSKWNNKTGDTTIPHQIVSLREEKDARVRKGTPEVQEYVGSEEKFYSCMYCDKKFERRSGKLSHEMIHRGEKPYFCKYCNKTFKRIPNKIQHERIHTGEKPYPCNYCSKRFVSSSDKRKHERIHTGEKPFSCRFCSKSFASSWNKTTHERIHYREKPSILMQLLQ